MAEDQVFTILVNGQQVWWAIVDDEIVKADWPDKGTALAGLEVEQRRHYSKRMNNHPFSSTPDNGPCACCGKKRYDIVHKTPDGGEW